MDQTALSPRYPLRVRIGLALVLALLLLSQLVLIIHLAQTLPSAMATESMARYEKRYAEARKFLPRVGVIGYLGDPPDSGGVTQGLYQRRYHSAEYILAPLVIADSLEPDLILGNFFIPPRHGKGDLRASLDCALRLPQRRLHPPQGRLMMAGLILSFALALLMGMAIVTLLWPRRRLQADLLMKASLATGLGLGATSCLWFLGLAAAPGHLDNLPVAEIVVLAVLVTCAVLRHSARKISARRFEGDGPVDARRAGGGPRGLPGGRGRVRPGLGARAARRLGRVERAEPPRPFPLSRRRAMDRASFSKPLTWSSLDYPLLLPLSVMRSWVFAGGETVAGSDPGRLRLLLQFWPAALFVLFTALRNPLEGS